MKLNLILSIVVFVFISGTNAFAKKQKADTVMTVYSSGKVRSICTYDKEEFQPKTLISFFSEEGEDLLKKKDFTYSYVDERMKMKREINIQDYRIVSEYFIDGNDTIYIHANFDKEFKKQWKKFLEYAKIKSYYPAEALENGKEGNVGVYFIVDKLGKIVLIDTLTEPEHGFGASARKAVRDYKHWGVVTINKKPVNCFLYLNMKFKINP